MPDSRRPILYKGELYSNPIDKSNGGPQKEPQQTYEEARGKLIDRIQHTQSIIANLPQTFRLPHEVVICVRLQPDFSAKSYYPVALFDEQSEMGEFEEIGSRNWRLPDNAEEEENEAKLFFVRTTDQVLEQLSRKLNRKETDLTKKFMFDVRKIDSLDVLTPEERILGIPAEWTDGRLEAVLHPFQKDNQIVFDHFVKLLNDAGIDENTVKRKQYDRGVTFVSLRGNRKLLDLAKEYNPLRMMHPLEARAIPTFRGTPVAGAPRPPEYTTKPSVIVGMFDGGLSSNNPYLENYAENVDCTPAARIQPGTDHGTAVAGVMLYGPLNNYKRTDVLPEPSIFVKSFRVLPTSNPADIDLYEVIDIIESIIPQEKGIKVYNLSLGPQGPIVDDHISRFTYALDLLSEKHNVLFCVAVGNDGDLDDPYNRIQAPADIVNGLGVGAYTLKNRKIERAFYSCIGPGREGNKLKPDISALGGCDQAPIHLLSTALGQKVLAWGTSFAAPFVSGLAGQIIGRSNGAMDSLVARAMLIHNSKRLGKGHTRHLGHGIMPETVEDLVTCLDKSYTLIYQGELLPGKYAKLEIPWPDDMITGPVRFRWTMAVMAPIDPTSSDDYTACSLMTSFYPNSQKYLFTDPTGTKTARIDIESNQDQAIELEAMGWKRGTFPISELGPKNFADEDALRLEKKWDTIDTRSKTKRDATKVKAPMFHIHALSRGKHNPTTKIKYTLVLSVEAPRSTVDLYAKVLQKYPALLPLNLQVRNEVRVQ